MKPEFKLHKVIKRYGTREVVNVEDLNIPGGEIYGILGPNGSGKTTLLRIMGLLGRNDEGDLQVLNEPIHWSKDQLLRLRRQMATVTQTSYMFQGSVYNNVAYGLKVRRLPERKIKKKVTEALELLNMTSFINADARKLSGGERQKVAIARALAIAPRVLFLDEPTSNIDPGSAREIEEHIRKINQQYQTTIILVTHNLFQARRLADKIFFLWEGKIIEQGSAEELFANPQDERTKAFIEGETFY